MKAKHRSWIQIVRHIVQLMAFLLFPELFITVFHAFGDVVTALTRGEFSVYTLWSQLITAAVVLVLTAVWGRFFCGFLCSFGALQELIFEVTQKLLPHKTALPAGLDRGLRYFKYLVLAFLVVAVWILALPMDSAFSPWGTFGMLISGNRSVMAAAIPTVGFVLLLVFAAGSVFVERFFCRYFCPLGAVFALVSGKRFYKIRRQKNRCTECGLCERNCSMDIPILKQGTVSSGECINCMQCVTVCPRQCLVAHPDPALAGTAAAITMCGLVQIGNLTVPDQPTAQNAYSLEDSARGSYTDGVYTGSGMGFRGNTDVQVTVENGYITDITVLSYEDDPEFFQKAQSSLLGQILSTQSVGVQNVSGATFSSNGILDAVANALGLDRQSETEPSGQMESPQTASESASDDDSAQALPEENAAAESDSGAAQDFSDLADGTYQGEGEGFRGNTSVSVTVENGKVTDITVVSYEDDDAFFTRAESTMIEEILEAQSLDVSCVSGATFSSNGILEAVANALQVSFENPNQSSAGAGKGGHGGHNFGRHRG